MFKEAHQRAIDRQSTLHNLHYPVQKVRCLDLAWVDKSIYLFMNLLFQPMLGRGLPQETTTSSTNIESG